MKKVIVAVVLVVLFLAGCRPEAEEENHFHALAFDPTEPGVWYGSTHHSIERHQDHQMTELGRDDYMGLVIGKDGTFYSSGHSAAIPNVGIRKSTDKGKSWETLDYAGLDFHDLAVTYANPLLIYAWSTPPEELFVLSRDGGESWETIDADLRQDLYSLAADQQQENKVYAGTLLGLFVSEDYGRTWRAVESMQDNAIIAVADDPENEGTTYLSTFSRGTVKTIDNGNSWEEINSGLPDSEQNPLLFLTVAPATGEVWGFNRDNEIFWYGGERWDKMKLGDEE